MFVLHAKKNRLIVEKAEPVTSGSANVYSVQFTFSEEWEGMSRSAIFKAGAVAKEVLLDEMGRCTIPWEVMIVHGVHLMAGVCGTSDGKVILPTIWANIAKILEGVPAGRSIPPTPELWQQELDRKQDKLTGKPGQIVAFDEHGNPIAQDMAPVESDSSNHRHPINAITGLEEALSHIPVPMTAAELQNIINGGTKDE